MTGPRYAKGEKIELVPDAWPRFEKFIREIAKAGPQHRSGGAAVKTEPKAAKKRAKVATSNKSSKAKGRWTFVKRHFHNQA
jgi:hypothetical protein